MEAEDSSAAAQTWYFLPDAAFDALVAQILVEPESARETPFVRRKDDGSTLLHVVAGWKHSEQIVRDLIEAGVPPDVRDDSGWTPLLEAAQEGQFAVCQALLEAGATPDLPCGEVTPLHAAVEVGNEEMVRWLLRQPGTWPRRYNGEFFAFLLEKVPEAVTDYLDVFATVLNHSHKGYEAVKYTDLKWHSFARTMFRQELTAYTLLVASYFIPTVWGSPDWIHLKTKTHKMVAALRFISWLLSIFLLLCVERSECRGEGVRRYFSSFWNWIGVTTYAAIICSIPLEFISFSELTQQARNSVLALIIVCLWINLLQFLQMSRNSGLIIAMMVHMVKDIYRFFLLYSVFLLGFSGAFYLLLGGTSGYETFTTSFITVYLMLYGQLTYDNFKDAKGYTWYTSNFLLLVHLLSAVVVLLNILIAMMATTYAEVWDAAEAEALQSHAQAIVRLEKALTPKVRREKFLELLAVSKSKAGTRSTRERQYTVQKEEEPQEDLSVSAREARRQNIILGVAKKMRKISSVNKSSQARNSQQNRVVPVAESSDEVDQPGQDYPPKLKYIARQASRFAVHELAQDVVALNAAMKKPVYSVLEDGVRYETPKKSTRGQGKDEMQQQLTLSQQIRQQQQLVDLQAQVEQLTTAMTNLQASLLTKRIPGPPIPKY
ncbi:hypothetical protein, variant 3 [Phytophthora nicotianae]|uniref:Polycystin cation channel PKD1/PKD2 domain-containing protein n=3 Tax=Phytophthora nicotianae TaxID=4792 RepID=W2GWJ6_PHYNI|nr:hypothetical protein, variant 3 [Phytophthora nicotianae]ETL40668.1 hypothetical protein, variant 3 [Phytophthora nicotianae]